MRTLHVVEPWSPPGPLSGNVDGACCGDMAVLACRAVAESADAADHAILVLGGAASGRRAAALGLAGFDRIAPPLGRAALARGIITRWLESRAPFERAILWNSADADQWPRLAREVVAFDPGRGTLGAFPEPLPSQVLTRAAVERLRATRRDMRARLGLAQDDECVCLLGDGPGSANAANFAFLLALLHETGRIATGILSTGSFHATRALDPRRLQPLGVRLVGTDEPMALIFPACDLAVHAPGSRLDSSAAPSTWRDAALAHLAWSLGVPVLSATPKVVAPQGRDACLAPTAHPSAIAHAITELSPARARELGRGLTRAHGTGDRSPFAEVVARALGMPLPAASGAPR